MLNLLDQSQRQGIITEIIGSDEVTRRAEALKRHDIYKDGGKRFLLEAIRREFNEDAIKEMRLVPLNLLKKIVNKRSSIYKRPPMRTAKDATDKALLDHYVQELKVNNLFQKANRYFNLFSNTAVYVVPQPEGGLKACVVPSYLYSLIPDPIDRTRINAVVFNAFVQEGRLFATESQTSATGKEGYTREHTTLTKSGTQGNRVDSLETRAEDDSTQYVFWSKEAHLTTDSTGSPILVAGVDPNEQVQNPIGRISAVFIAKDRDNEPWARQGDDLIDLTLALQSGWTDLATIAKHQGFAILTVSSEEEPKKITLGVNKAVWLKLMKDGPTPTIDYKSSTADLAAYKELLAELLGLLLSTNDMNPKSISGAMTATQATSGFHALIENADILDARDEDKPAMLDAEKDFWQLTKAWHNTMHDAGAGLTNEAMALGKFTDEFNPEIYYADVKPLESEEDRLSSVERQVRLNLMTRSRALKRLYPDMTDEMIIEELRLIDAEKKERMTQAQADMAAAGINPVEPVEGEDTKPGEPAAEDDPKEPDDDQGEKPPGKAKRPKGKKFPKAP